MSVVLDHISEQTQHICSESTPFQLCSHFYHYACDKCEQVLLDVNEDNFEKTVRPWLAGYPQTDYYLSPTPR